MKTIIKKNMPAFALGGAALFALLLAGCNTIVRENIISSIDTGIGASVAENKQTQMYELKAGYIRSQFYSIPTGKLVKNEKAHGTNGVSNLQDMRSNRADITPQLVAGIRSHTGLQDIFLGMDISENFAVGSVAVMSPAATAMYIAEAKDPASAKAASEAVQGKDTADNIAKTLADPTHKQDVDALNLLIKKPLTKAVTANNQSFKAGDSAELYADALAAEKGETLADVRVKTSLWDTLKAINTKLDDATK